MTCVGAKAIPVISALLLLLCSILLPGCGGSGNYEEAWHFDRPGDYVFDAQVVSVGEAGASLASLKRLPEDALWTALYVDPRPMHGPEYHGVIQDPDGNILAIGTVADFDAGTGELILAKYNQAGALLPGWPVLYGGTGLRWNEGHDARVDAAGNIVIAGYVITRGEQWRLALWKFEPDGNLLAGWPQYPAGPQAYGSGVIIDSQGAIVACGSEGPTGYERMVLVKYMADGTAAAGWPKTYEVEGSAENFAYDVLEDEEGNLVVAGYTATGENDRNAVLWKLDANGNMLAGWPKLWDSGAAVYDEYFAISQDMGGDYCVVGITEGTTEDNGKLLVTRYNAQGEQLTSSGWPQVFECNGVRDWSPPDAWGGSVDSEGNIAAAVTCQSETQVRTVKYTRQGTMAAGFPKTWNRDGYFDATRGCCVDSLDNIYTVGFSEKDDGTESDYSTFVAKYAPALYSTGAPSVVTAGFSYKTLKGFREVLGPDNQGSASYQLSPDGQRWFRYRDGEWGEAGGRLETNSASEVDAHIASFAATAGGGTLYVKAFLVSDGSQEVQLDSIDLDCTR